MRASESSHVEKSDWARERDMSFGCKVAVRGRHSNLLHCPFSLSRRLAGLLTTRTFSLYCTTNDTNRTLRPMSDARRHGRRAFKALMRSHHLTIPKYDLPLRFRPVSRPPSPMFAHSSNILFLRQWFVALTFLVMLSLALLGLTNLSIPLNDKLLHFFCLGIATGVFYFIFDVEE